MLPKKEAEPERYEGRPLLIVLEHYVLAVIGQLGPEKSHAMMGVVQKVFGGGDDWKTTVRQRLGLTDAFDAEVLTLWRKNRHLAAQGGVELHPVQFAKMFADENFAPLFEGNGSDL
jgi:hypothetical protein